MCISSNPNYTETQERWFFLSEVFLSTSFQTHLNVMQIPTPVANAQRIVEQVAAALIIVLHTTAVSAQPGESDFSGRYVGESNGVQTTLTLAQSGVRIDGQGTEGGSRYQLTATVDGEVASGSVHDPQSGGTFQIELSLQGERLIFTMLQLDPFTGEIQRVAVEFARMDESASPEAAKASASAEAEVGGERDPRLVGVWTYQEIMTGGGVSVATEMAVQLRADGIAVEGDARTVGGGADWSGDTGRSSDVTTYRWKTENGAVYGAPADGGQWTRIADYETNGSRLLMMYVNGERQLWYRQ